MAEEYIAFCEKLWRDWLEHKLFASSFVRKVFDVDAAQEPYLLFETGKNPLVALTTNPGATMWHQCRAAVKARTGPLREEDTYAEAARKLGDFCKTHLTGQARQRIDKLEKLSESLGYEGVMQVEAIPFHSPDLPQKNALLEPIKKAELLGSYAGQLESFLRDKPVVIPQTSNRPEKRSSRWLTWITTVAGLNLSRAEFVPLVWKDTEITGAAWVSGEGVGKPLVLMMGMTTLPAE
jgi:hypothetical protein